MHLTNVKYLSFESETELTSIELDLCAVEIEPEIVPLICPVTIRSEATLTESDPVAALMYKSPELVLIVLASTVAIPILPATIPFTNTTCYSNTIGKCRHSCDISLCSNINGICRGI